jgi:formylglycine-generating enzyme required for sulfatase activity
MDQGEITNAQFASFVKESGYQTDAERLGDSFVFHTLLPPDVDALVDTVVAGAEWYVPT